MMVTKIPVYNNLISTIIKRYKNTSIWTRFFIRARIAILPLANIEQRVPKKGVVVDLGCGHGIFAHYLMLTSKQRFIIGIEKNPYTVTIAQSTCSQKMPLRFITGDVTLIQSYSHISAVTCIDLFHHLTFHNQIAVLNIAAQSLQSGGKLIIKDIEKELTWRYYWNLFHDRIMRLSEPTYHRTATDFKRLIEEAGLRFVREEHWVLGPYHHICIIAEKH